METRAESGAWGKKRRDELQGADLGLERAKIHDAWDASEVEARGDERAWEGSEDLEAQWRPTPLTTDRFESLSFAAAASILRAPPLAARPPARPQSGIVQLSDNFLILLSRSIAQFRQMPESTVAVVPIVWEKYIFPLSRACWA